MMASPVPIAAPSGDPVIASVLVSDPFDSAAEPEPSPPELPVFVVVGDATGVTTAEANSPVPFAFDATTFTE